jgi:long-chain acyl-CoA synthetase
MNARPFPWEKQYPPQVSWDLDIPKETLPEFLDHTVAAHGDRTLFEFRGGKITYAEFGRMVDTAAVRLQRLGVGHGVSVALYIPNTPWHPISFFAVLKAGGRVVHLSPLDPPRVLAKKMADGDARILIATNLPPLFASAMTLLNEGAAERLVVGDDDVWGKSGVAQHVPDDPRISLCTNAPGDASGPFPALKPEDVALLQYTGGTTGFPKAAMLTHANLLAAVRIYESWDHPSFVPIDKDDRLIGVLPFFHIYALTVVLLRSVSVGATILLQPRFDVEATLRDIEVNKATVFPGVPTMWIALANLPGIETRDLSSLRFAGSGGAPLPSEVRQKFNQLTGLRLGGGWGMTETAPAGTMMDGAREYAHGAIGIPLPRIEIDIVALDNPRKVLPPGEVGEIRVRGPNVFVGYWKRPEETERAFVDGYFLTGDMGYMDTDGDFYIVDRKKDMIISGGFNVYPSVIEEAVYEHPDVAEAIVIGVPDQYRGQAAKVFVVLKAGAAEMDLDTLRNFLGDKLGKHEMPSALDIRDSLPKTQVGKLSRKELVDEELAKTTSA